MADLSENDAAGVGQGPGSQLRKARERRGLTQREVAEELHVDLWMIDALERDDFATLGAPVFAKGHMRKYAGMVGIPIDELLVAYYRVRGREQSPPLVADSLVTHERPRKRAPKVTLALLGILAVLGVLALAAWFVLDFGTPASTPATDAVPARPPVSGRAYPAPTSVPIPVAQVAGEGFETQVDESPVARSAEAPGAAPIVPIGADRETLADPTDASAATPAPATPADAVAAEPSDSPGLRQLRLRFSEDSWVEVYDAGRNRLLYGMGNAGSTETLRGPPPIQVFLGRQSAVEIDVDGRPYRVPDNAGRGDIARFIIE